MKQFILNGEPARDKKIRLSGEDYHYLVNVRRLAPGESFPALLPSGVPVVIRIKSVDGGVLTGECCRDDAAASGRAVSDAPDEINAKADMTEGMPPVILFQALPKGEKMDLIVRQAAEGGLAEIVPFQGEFSVPKIKRREGEKKRGLPEGSSCYAKLSRWKRIVKEARQQSGSPVATVVRDPVAAGDIFGYWDTLKTKYPGALGILFHQVPVESGQNESGSPARAVPLEKASLHGYLDKNPRLVVLAIGPEGGFSSAEVSRFLEAGFKPVTIGNTVLRTETAAIYAAAAIRIILLERNSWKVKKSRCGTE